MSSVPRKYRESRGGRGEGMVVVGVDFKFDEEPK